MARRSSALMESPPAKRGGSSAVEEWEPIVSDKIFCRQELYSLASTFMLNQNPPKQCYIKRKSGSLYYICCTGSQSNGACPFNIRCTVCDGRKTDGSGGGGVKISGYDPNHTNCDAGSVNPALEDLLQMSDLCSYAVKTTKLQDIIDYAKVHCSVKMSLSKAMASRLREALLNQVRRHNHC